MLERTDAIMNEVLEPITFVLAYPTLMRTGCVHTLRMRLFRSQYSITPLIPINWEGTPSGYAENPDNWIFL